ncbi:uncharacterized protein LOC125192006 isoform X1 [Salvia hispanica]|uniref:uncharacterized protein LOC125192006 isoform X1 n=1 Tax=Salvia hispanica TaxID=49212 RepID=UPI00200906B4|nr:uncharacterized protein LOC125192006 isoform X1 [Salvia hispanica]
MEDGSATARRVMVVADGSRESTTALQYALSHALMDNDTLILLHVAPPRNAFGGFFKNPISPGSAGFSGSPTSSGEGSVGRNRNRGGGNGSGGEADFLDGMKRACAAAKPTLKVAVEKAEAAEGKDKAAAIVSHSAASNVELLIIGRKRNALSKSILAYNSMNKTVSDRCRIAKMCCFGRARRGLLFKGLMEMETAEYAIENSKCTCVSVQRKTNGGYLLNSKRHKNFWLLA